MRAERREPGEPVRAPRRLASSAAVGEAMEIRLNGKSREVPDGVTVSGLLEELRLHAQRVAVMVNEEIVKRDRFGEVALQPGDRVEVLTIMAGG